MPDVSHKLSQKGNNWSEVGTNPAAQMVASLASRATELQPLGQNGSSGAPGPYCFLPSLPSGQDLLAGPTEQPARNSTNVVDVNGHAPKKPPYVFHGDVSLPNQECWMGVSSPGLHLNVGLYRTSSAYRALDVCCRARPSEISVVCSVLTLST